MYWCEDNFLSEPLFEKFSKEVAKQYSGPRKDWYIHDNHAYGKELSGKDYKLTAPVREVGVNYPETDNYVSSSNQLQSASLPKVMECIKEHMKGKLKLTNPTARMLWFQYHTINSKVIPHYDYQLKDTKSSKQCFSSILYTHHNWGDEWGGELCFNTEQFLPKPNRLVTYSRDERHWVNDVLHNHKHYVRTLLFTGWATDNDI